MADDVVKDAREALRLSYEFDRDNRTQAIEDLRFVAGFQWSDQARTEREGRPIITINRSGQFIRQVANPIRQNMPTLKVEPDGDDQQQMADLANGMLRRIQYNSSASHVYANAVEHMVACGIGWFRATSDYCDDTSFDQEIKIKRIFNPLSVYPDPSALEPDRSDMTFAVVSEMWTTAAFEKKWPGKSVTGIDAPNQSQGAQSAPSIAWGTADSIRVGEFWQRKESSKKLHQMRDGSVVDMDSMPEELQQQVKPHIVNERQVKGYTVTMQMVSGVEILEETYTCPCKWIPLIPVIGAEIPLETGTYRHGLIRFQREPQMLHNYFMSVAAETLAAQPKSPFLAPAKLIERYKGIWDKHNTVPTPYLPYDPDPGMPQLKPERVFPPPLPNGLITMAQMLADDMKATTGIYDAALGAKSNETSGVAIDARTHQGDQATFHFVDNLEHGLEHLGRILLDMMPKVYDTQRTVKIRLPDDTEQTRQLNQPTVGYQQDGQGEPQHGYDNDMSKMTFSNIQVILGPNFQSRRREAQTQLTALLQAVPEIAQIGGDIIVRQYDFDGADDLADRLKAVLPPPVQAVLKDKEAEETGQPAQPPQPSPEQQQAAQAQQAAMEAEVDKNKAAAMLSNAQARMVEAQTLATYGYLIPPGEPGPDGTVANVPRMIPPTDPVKAAQAAKAHAEVEKTQAGTLKTHADLSKVLADTRNAHAQADAAHMNNALTADQADQGNHPSQQPPEPPAQNGAAA